MLDQGLKGQVIQTVEMFLRLVDQLKNVFNDFRGGLVWKEHREESAQTAHLQTHGFTVG
jgi:hypothetical protein